MIRSVHELYGYTILAEDGRIGIVRDLILDEKSWKVCFLHVDLMDLIPGRCGLIPTSKLGQPNYETMDFPVLLTKEQVRDAPTMHVNDVTYQKFANELYSHFGWDPCWSIEEKEKVVNKQQLTPDTSAKLYPRSSREIIGYCVQAIDGKIGYIEDFILDDQEWKIRYVVIHTRNWLPGRKVLISPSWLNKVVWKEFKVHVDHSRREIKNSPEYDPDTPVNRQYEEVLYNYYGQAKYWN